MNKNLGDPDHDQELLFLIIDKETALVRSLLQELEAAGHCAEQARNGQEALSLLEAKPYSGVVVDVDMDDMDGAEFILQVRKIQPELLIFVLTAQPTLRSAVAAIKASAADYILKPTIVSTVVKAIFAGIEKRINQRNQLWQMVQNVLHSSDGSQATSEGTPAIITPRSRVQIVPPIRLEHSRRLVTFTDRSTKAIKLSRGETAVLSCLMDHPDQPIPIAKIAYTALDYFLEEEEAKQLVRPYIFRLRQKLERDAKSPQLILTIPRKGYMFVSTP